MILNTESKEGENGLKIISRKRLYDKKVSVLLEEPPTPNCSQPVCTGPLSQIYCSGKLIQITWMFGLHESCPGDMMLKSAELILEEFNKLKFPIKREDFQRFCAENFASVSYLKQATLVDWTEEPASIKRLQDEELKNFTRKLNGLWKVLGREFVEQVKQTPDRFPVLPVPNAFIVPGGSFQIYFYWDSYWINKGLLFLNMTTTVRHILENFASVVEFHGFIPNSGSVHLSRRSQPPLFTQMVADYYEATRNKTFLKGMMPWMDQEISWWIENRAVNVKSSSGRKYQMYQYRAPSNCPRPENFLTDISNGLNGTGQPQFIWSSIASACESGLDFSTRWFAYHGKYAGTKYAIRTNDILPVDLNVFMAWNFATLANLYEVFGENGAAVKYRKLYKELHEAIDALFWSESDGAWFDYDLTEKKLRKKFYSSNIFPLLLGDSSLHTTQKVLSYLLRSGVLDFKGGIPVSLNNGSHEQWDYPNGWAPLIHLFVESLRVSGDKKLIQLAEKIAWKFIRTVYNGLMKPAKGMPSACWEKYDVRFSDGRPGLGGEYPVQQGFGWTNGAVLDLIYKYGTFHPIQTHMEAYIAEMPNTGKILSMNRKLSLFLTFLFLGLLVIWLMTLSLLRWEKTYIVGKDLQLAEAIGLLDDE